MLSNKNPATRNRTRDHLIAAALYSQMLYQLSYSRSVGQGTCSMSFQSGCSARVLFIGTRIPDWESQGEGDAPFANKLRIFGKS